MWQKQFEATGLSPNSLMIAFSQALSVLRLSFPSAFHIQLEQFEPIPILDFTRKDLKQLLQFLCRNECYHKATFIPRKDLKPPKGMLDFE